MKFASSVCLVNACVLAGSAHAVAITTGDVTAELGPNFFFDNAATGGSDATQNEPGAFNPKRNFGAMNVGAGGTQIDILGIGWASPNWVNTDATTVTVTITYLGADGANDGGDDVVIGTASDSFNFNGAGEYVFEFDTPMSAVIDGVNSEFRVRIAPSNDSGDGSMRIKQDIGGIKLSVAGTSTALNNAVPGDIDGDGDIDDADLGTSFANYTGPVGAVGGKDASTGDTDADGDVDDADLGTSFAGYTGPLGPAAVPEPASLALVSLGGLFLTRRRRA